MTYYCCEIRLTAAPCNCSAGFCAWCKRCEFHCACPADIREIVFDDEADLGAEPAIVSRVAVSPGSVVA